ncbi:transposase [Aquipseudomonas campi]|uniref:Transposase n=1 Tax=Aquipseudomonas campi TaxID=2731681 RepID=A0A6M8FUG1_9GAMM|nr:transposase [Pseudomonas campi]QKE63545.1 transposase [Pseudomonas campi]QKE63596.1 transposase [Pseudomonas campi]
MTTITSQTVAGVDVAKTELVVYRADLQETLIVINELGPIKKWLRSLPKGSLIALEATSSYHIQTVELAHAMGHTLYVIDGYRLSNYRKGTGGRSKTDFSDARLLARYLTNELEDLRPWSPPPKGFSKLQGLMRKRSQLVQIKVALNQSWADEPMLKRQLKELLAVIAKVDTQIQKMLHTLIEEAGLTSQVRRCEGIEGVGPLTAAALATSFSRGDFKSSDAFIAFLGLDLRVSDSGQKTGRRRLSKRGDSEPRRLLHNASMAASRSDIWKPVYERYLARGLKATQVYVIMARKIARVAFALMKNQSEYQPAGMEGVA